MPFYFNEESGRGISTSARFAGGVASGWKSYSSIKAFNESRQKKASSVPSAAPAPAGPDLDAIRKRLMGSQEEALASGTKGINRQAFQSSQQGMSDLISKGMSGTTAVGGMEAGIAEGAAGAKTELASNLQARTDDMMFKYTSLAQQASEGKANRETSAAMDAQNRLPTPYTSSPAKKSTGTTYAQQKAINSTSNRAVTAAASSFKPNKYANRRKG